MGKRIELREGQTFFNARAGKYRRVVSVVEYKRPTGNFLSPIKEELHVVYSFGGNMNRRCQRDQFLRFVSQAEDITGKEIVVEGSLI